jgi:site-specific DNA-cytosine methylase
MVQHEVFVIESVPNIASARGGHLLASIYSAAADVNYVPPLLMLDPQRTGGAQSRCRA